MPARRLEMEVEDARGAVVEVAVARVPAFMQGGQDGEAEAGEEHRSGAAELPSRGECAFGASRSLILDPSRGSWAGGFRVGAGVGKERV